MKEIDVYTAFSAMIVFLKQYWERGGKSSDDIAVLLGSLARGADDLPMDIALWHDWIRAYSEATSDTDEKSSDGSNNGLQ